MSPVSSKPTNPASAQSNPPHGKAASNVQSPSVAPPGAAASVSSKGERFRAGMPEIPGVAGVNAGKRQESQKRILIAVGIGAAVLVAALIGWRMLRNGSRPNAPATEAEAPSPAPEELPPPQAAPRTQTALNEIGTFADFPRPWTFKKFTYSHGLSRDSVAAMAIRLPGGDGHSSSSYWGILLKAPYGQCDLEFVADASQINAKFGYHAAHPMVVDACSATVYDPLQLGTLPNGAWARGAIVQGAGFRPPLQVEIRVEGDKLIAGRSED